MLLNSASTPGELDNYLHFDVSGGTTRLYISTSGLFSDSNAVTTGTLPTNVSSNDVQQIVINGVDLVGSNLTDQAVIQDLLSKGKLIVDS